MTESRGIYRRRGTGSIRNGYLFVVENGKAIQEHRKIAQRILGRTLKSEEVHHVNENKSDNAHSNLVICPNHAYHMLLHRRTRAYDACGHADWLLCRFCKKYDYPESIKQYPKTGRIRVTGHQECIRQYIKYQHLKRRECLSHK